MNKKLFIGLAVASVGTIATMGTAAALYYNAPETITINVGARTNKDLVCKIQNLAWKDGVSKLKPNQTPVLEFDVGAEKTLDSTYTQNVMIGRLTIEVSSGNEDFINYYSDKLCLTVDYEENTFYTKEDRNRADSSKQDGKIVISKQFPVKLAGQHVNFKLPTSASITKEDMLKIAGAEFSINVNWEQADDFNYAYVVGDFTDPAWTQTEEYQMVPNLNTEGFEWMYQVDEAHRALLVEGKNYKCNKTENETTTWSGPQEGNNTIGAYQSGKLTGIYWTGAENAAPTYSVVE